MVIACIDINLHSDIMGSVRLICQAIDKTICSSLGIIMDVSEGIVCTDRQIAMCDISDQSDLDIVNGILSIFIHPAIG